MPETKITNEQIATAVMGWKVRNVLTQNSPAKVPMCYRADNQTLPKSIPQFLTNLNAAELIIKKLYADGMFVSIDNDYIGDKYDVMFFGKASENEAQNKSLCIAICEAALKAVRS